MSTDAAHRQGWRTFEVVFGVPLLAALALHYLVPLRFPAGALTPALLAIGIVLAFAGSVLVVLARRQFAQHHQPTDPGRPTSQLITTGIFSYSRNPLYLGGVVVLVGIALMFNAPWVLVLLVPALVWCHIALIKPEERYLAAKFGAEYQSYAATVRRWFGRAQHRG